MNKTSLAQTAARAVDTICWGLLLCWIIRITRHDVDQFNPGNQSINPQNTNDMLHPGPNISELYAELNGNIPAFAMQERRAQSMDSSPSPTTSEEIYARMFAEFDEAFRRARGGKVEYVVEGNVLRTINRAQLVFEGRVKSAVPLYYPRWIRRISRPGHIPVTKRPEILMMKDCAIYGCNDRERTHVLSKSVLIFVLSMAITNLHANRGRYKEPVIIRVADVFLSPTRPQKLYSMVFMYNTQMGMGRKAYNRGIQIVFKRGKPTDEYDGRKYLPKANVLGFTTKPEFVNDSSDSKLIRITEIECNLDNEKLKVEIQSLGQNAVLELLRGPQAGLMNRGATTSATTP